MKKKFIYMAPLLIVVLVAALVGCPSASTTEFVEQATERHPTWKNNLKDQRVAHIMWGEPEEDPRQVIGYELDDGYGTKYFDHYVMLYGFRLRVANCSQILEDYRVHCNLNGLHICMDVNPNFYKERWDEYLMPVRNAGIKVIMSIVPAGGGVAMGTLYRWPMEEWYPWAECATGGEDEYPFGEEAAARLIQQLVEFHAQYPFDGIGYDEEYGNLDGTHHGGERGRESVYPNGTIYPGIDIGRARRIGGENILRFSHELLMALAQANDETPEEFKKKFTFETYEIQYGEWIPASYTYPADHPVYPGKTIYRIDLLDYAYDAFYGGWKENTGLTGFPKSRFGPAVVAISDVAGSPKPSYGSQILQNMTRHLEGNFGVVMYYCLRDREQVKIKFPDSFGPNNAPAEDYFSYISETLHGYRTVYRGPDYPRVHEVQQ